MIKYMVSRINKIRNMIKKFIGEDLNMLQKALIVIDLSFSIIVYGAGITDYFQYHFYKIRHVERQNFIVHRKRIKIVKTCNDKRNRKVFDEKKIFNKVFNKYIGRDWADTDDITYKMFKDFVRKHPAFIVKPNVGSGGVGIYIEVITQESDIKAIYYRLKKEKALIEEIIKQHSEIMEFNPTSLNTLRIVTFIPKDEKAPKLMTGNLRLGRKDKIADNFHHQGIVALIDVDTGIVKTAAINMKGQRYIIHPDSKKQIIGYKIPYWEKVKETCINAAKEIDGVRYIGWDISIGENGEIYIIEGNFAADPDITQVADQVGKWPMYKKNI